MCDIAQAIQKPDIPMNSFQNRAYRQKPSLAAKQPFILMNGSPNRPFTS
jgi:hypothetical protein